MKRLALLVALLATASAVLAAAPDAPPNVPAEVKETTTFTVKVEPGKKLGWQVAFDKKDCLLVRVYTNNPDEYEFLVQPKIPGKFGIAFWTVGDAAGTFTVIGGAGTSTPPAPPDKPPVDPPGDPQPSVSLYFALVRPDGPASAGFEQVLRMPGWAQLRKNGHLVKDMELSNARALGLVIPEGTPLPCVATLKKSALGTHDQLYVSGKPWLRPLPTNTNDVLKLTEGVAP